MGLLNDHHIEGSKIIYIILLSELRAVLLGTSWSERSSVGNFILGTNGFNTEEEPDRCVSVSRMSKDQRITLINTPNLLQPDISQKNLTEEVEDCVRLSGPGPHLFLLVLQPEDFTEEKSRRLQSILENFGQQAWSRSVLLISTPEDETSSRLQETFPSLRDLIKKCRKTLQWNKKLQPHLLTCIKDLMEENHGEHVAPDVFRDALSDLPSGPQSLEPGRVSTSSSQDPVDGTHGLRIVLFGKSDYGKTALGNFITGKQEFKGIPSWFRGEKQSVSVSGEWDRKPLTVVKTPDLFNVPVETVRTEVKRCVDLCSPGPNVLLLLVKKSEFTEEDRKTLMFILSLFGQDVFKHSMVVLTHEDEARYSPADKLIQDCQQKVHHFTVDWKNPSKQEIQELMQKMETLASTNRGQFLFEDEEPDVGPVSRNPKPPLNLVLFGRRGAGKTSAVKALLGPGRLGPAADSSQCVRNQGQACGRWVSVVELPALSGRPEEEVMEECLRCVSLCDPEGVHAFILVLPVASLTDEDKGELLTVQKTFSSRVNDFTIILFTVESDPSAHDVLTENKELQKLCQPCHRRHFVLSINGRQELSGLIDIVEAMRRDRNEPHAYTMKTFCKAQIENFTKQEKEIQLLQSKFKNPKDKITGDEEEKQKTECLRIVLLGKTGSGKSSSGNTILGRTEFRADVGQKSVTKYCQKAVGQVDSRAVTVVDTPGLFDDSLSNEEINEELVKCVSLLAPGPHVFLLVLRIGRLTPEEKDTLKLIREGFGKNSLNFAFILLTGGDELEKAQVSDEEYIRDRCDDSFRSLIANCGGRYHVFNNDKKDSRQVRQLIAKIDAMLRKNGGDCFTNAMLQEAETAIKKEVEKILMKKEEEMKREREELEKKHDEELQTVMKKMEKQRAELEEERKVIEEQLKEKEENIRKEREIRKREHEEREKEDKKRQRQDEAQRREWKYRLEALEKKIKSECEQKETIDKKLVETREEMRKERGIWEKERKEWWKERKKMNREIEHKEQTELSKLQEEFEKEKEKYEKKRIEDEKKKEEGEKERRELEEYYKNKLENMKKKHEDEARKQAEEFNQFKSSKEKEFTALADEHVKNVSELKERQQKQKQQSEEEANSLKSQIVEMQEKFKEKLTDMTVLIMEQRKENQEKMKKLKTKHREDMNTLVSQLKTALDLEMNQKLHGLRQKQQNEMEALRKEPQTDKKEQREAEMFSKHKEEMGCLKTKVESQQKKNWREKMHQLQKLQGDEINEFRERLLNSFKPEMDIEALKKRHDEEMERLGQEITEGDLKEFKKLKRKHEEEMKKLNEKLFPKTCIIS